IAGAVDGGFAATSRKCDCVGRCQRRAGRGDLSCYACFYAGADGAGMSRQKSQTEVCVTGAVVIGLWLGAVGLLAADPAPRVVFTKSFPGSVPAWFSITIEQNGDAE